MAIKPKTNTAATDPAPEQTSIADPGPAQNASGAADAGTTPAAPARRGRIPGADTFTWTDARNAALVAALFSQPSPSGESLHAAVLASPDMTDADAALLTIVKTRSHLRTLLAKGKDEWAASGLAVPSLVKGARRTPETTAKLIAIAIAARAQKGAETGATQAS